MYHIYHPTYLEGKRECYTKWTKRIHIKKFVQVLVMLYMLSFLHSFCFLQLILPCSQLHLAEPRLAIQFALKWILIKPETFFFFCVEWKLCCFGNKLCYSCRWLNQEKENHIERMSCPNYMLKKKTFSTARVNPRRSNPLCTQWIWVGNMVR